jgi:hypothetical protein
MKQSIMQMAGMGEWQDEISQMMWWQSAMQQTMWPGQNMAWQNMQQLTPAEPIEWIPNV